MEFINRWKNSFIVTLIIMLLLLGFIAFKNENTITKGSIHVQKPVVFPHNTPKINEHTLVFFGYVGCPSICTPRMQEISEIYNNFKSKSSSKNLSVLFINLDESRSSEEADLYAKSFHPEFLGVSYKKRELLSTLRMFNAYYSHSMKESEEIEHTQFLYLVDKDTQDNFYLLYIYINVPFDKELITNDIIKDL